METDRLLVGLEIRQIRKQIILLTAKPSADTFREIALIRAGAQAQDAKTYPIAFEAGQRAARKEIGKWLKERGGKPAWASDIETLLCGDIPEEIN